MILLNPTRIMSRLGGEPNYTQSLNQARENLLEGLNTYIPFFSEKNDPEKLEDLRVRKICRGEVWHALSTQGS